MAYEVLARKWRPQQFDDVVGQTHVTQTLRNAITSDRVAHAYIFVGPRGTGKTTTARILAKALNCQKGGPTVTPCDQCDSCKEITSGSSLDVIEIDGASNNSVDQVRDLREGVAFAPARGPFKIYIIDEVHMLSISAFNALLKTLEEPPRHVKFFFATTDPQKVPTTILSRCQRFDLRRISLREIVGQIEKIAKAEQIEIAPDALLAIARGAEGGLRDATGALDQLVAFRGKKIAEPDVLAVFGLVAHQTLEALAQAVAQGDVAAALRIVAKLDANGKDLQRLVVELLGYFRDLLVCRYAGDAASLPDLTDDQIARLKQAAAQCEPDRLLRIVELLVEADSRMRYALSRRTLLELALIRGCRAARIASLDEVLKSVHAARAELAAGGGAVTADAPPMVAEEPAEYDTEPPPAPTPRPAASRPAASTPPGDELARLNQQWAALVEKVGNVILLAKKYLVDARPVSVAGNHVVIGFDPEFASELGNVQNARTQKVVQRFVGEVLGREVTVEFKVGGTAATAAPEPATPKDKREWHKHPAVNSVLEAFNGDIGDVR
jgi:DNA polymerase-3 subunit gamma/tau